MRAKKSESEPTILEDMAVLAAFTRVSFPSEEVSIAKLSSMYLHACEHVHACNPERSLRSPHNLSTPAHPQLSYSLYGVLPFPAVQHCWPEQKAVCDNVDSQPRRMESIGIKSLACHAEMPGRLLGLLGWRVAGAPHAWQYGIR